MNQGRYRIKTFLELIIAASVLVFADQWTKMLAVRHLKDQADVELIPNVLYLHYLENRGAAFGIFQEQKVFLLLLTFVILAAVCYVLWKLPTDRKYIFLKLVCFFVASGGIGNCIDRIRLDYVVDFIYIRLIDFPIFNVADMFVSIATVVGAVLLLFGHSYRDEDFSFLSLKKRKPEEEEKNG